MQTPLLLGQSSQCEKWHFFWLPTLGRPFLMLNVQQLFRISEDSNISTICGKVTLKSHFWTLVGKSVILMISCTLSSSRIKVLLFYPNMPWYLRDNVFLLEKVHTFTEETRVIPIYYPSLYAINITLSHWVIATCKGKEIPCKILR